MEMNDDESFQVSIPAKVELLWDELGYDSEHREQDIQSLEESIRSVISQFSENLENKCQETKNAINEIRDKHMRSMLAFGVSESDVTESFPALQKNNLLQQLESSKQAYENFMQVVSSRIQKIENLISIASELFDILGVSNEERGEFMALGDQDYSRERIERFKSKVNELKQAVEARRKEFTAITIQIRTLGEELGLQFSPEQEDLLNMRSLTAENLRKAEILRDELTETKKSRVEELSRLAVEITGLWDLLKTPESARKAFLESHKTISDDVIRSCRNEISNLSKQRDVLLPQLLKAQREEIKELWDKLHTAEECRTRFVDDNSSPEEKLRELKFIETEITRLNKILADFHVIISAIDQREEIIRDYRAATEKAPDPSRLTSRSREAAQQLIKEEKAIRRYKVSLPRHEKKLKEMLENYKLKHGADFEWEGSPYIECLSHIVLDKKPKKATTAANIETKGASMPSRIRSARATQKENIDPSHNQGISGKYAPRIKLL